MEGKQSFDIVLVAVFGIVSIIVYLLLGMAEFPDAIEYFSIIFMGSGEDAGKISWSIGKLITILMSLSIGKWVFAHMKSMEIERIRSEETNKNMEIFKKR